jgi:hypothetical protein
LGAFEDLVHGGHAITTEPKETTGGFDNATASGFTGWGHDDLLVGLS